MVLWFYGSMVKWLFYCNMNLIIEKIYILNN